MATPQKIVHYIQAVLEKIFSDNYLMGYFLKLLSSYKLIYSDYTVIEIQYVSEEKNRS